MLRACDGSFCASATAPASPQRWRETGDSTVETGHQGTTLVHLPVSFRSSAGHAGHARGGFGGGGEAWKNRYNESWELSRQHLLWF